MQFNRRAFTILEMLIVLSIIASLSSVLFWISKGSYQHAESALLQGLASDLNKQVHLYELHAAEVGKANVSFNSKNEAMDALCKPMPWNQVTLIEADSLDEKLLSRMSWDRGKNQFFVKTTKK